MVLYVVCYDLSASLNEQRRQIHTWLRYLNSLLCTHDMGKDAESFDHTDAKWRVIVAGMKADLQKGSPITSTAAWQRNFPAIPIQDEIYQVSTLTDEATAKDLFSAMESQCQQIMDLCNRLIPKSYRELLNVIREIKTSTNIIHTEEIKRVHKRWESDPKLVERAMRHLHDVGEIVMFTGGRVCTRPSAISRIMAKFISPEEVRNSLLVDEENEVTLLTKTDIDTILGVHKKGAK